MAPLKIPPPPPGRCICGAQRAQNEPSPTETPKIKTE